jgi:hypothetical protein
MRLRFEDHAGFQRATLHVAVACSALAAAGALAGSERGPAAAVLGAAVATLALALGHLRLVLDPVGEAMARAAAGADATRRALLARAANAHERIARAAGRARAPADRELATASRQAALALADLIGHGQALARAVDQARRADAAGELAALEAKRATAADPVVRDTYARAAAASRERAARATTIEGVVARIDARAVAAVTELEAAALASATRDDPDPAADIAHPCARLRAATADLGAEREAFAELASL